tara:strand:+ start:871 stop:1026 length:156 start_codon:yes stop_codon:yes gene_type:complete
MSSPRTTEDDLMDEWNYEDAFYLLDMFDEEFETINDRNPANDGEEEDDGEY